MGPIGLMGPMGPLGPLGPMSPMGPMGPWDGDDHQPTVYVHLVSRAQNQPSLKHESGTLM